MFQTGPPTWNRHPSPGRLWAPAWPDLPSRRSRYKAEACLVQQQLLHDKCGHRFGKFTSSMGHLEKYQKTWRSTSNNQTCDFFSQSTTWGTQVGKAGCFSCDQTFLCMRTIWMWNDVHLPKKTNVDPSPSGGASQKSGKTNMEALSNFRKQIGEGYMAYRAGTRWQKATWHPFLAMEVDQLRLFGNFQLL